MKSRKTLDSDVDKRVSHLNIKAVREALMQSSASDKHKPVRRLPNKKLPVLTPLSGHRWLKFLLTDYWCIRTAHREIATQKNELKAFKLLWAFLDYEKSVSGKEYERKESLDPRFISRLISWMSGKKGRKRLSDQTKASRYNAIKRFFHWLKFERQLLPADWPLRGNPWPLSHKKIKSAKTIPDSDLKRIIRAAKKEVESTINRWKETREVISNKQLVVPSATASVSAYKNRAIAIKAIHASFPVLIPCRDDVSIVRYGLADALRTYSHLTLEDMIARRYPTARTLVPFVLLMGMSSMFNPDTILKLRWSKISDNHPIFGTDRWRVTGEKKRGGKLQRRSFPANVTDIGNPVALLRALELQLAPIRKALPSNIRDQVFVFHKIHGNPRFGTFTPGVSRTMWEYCLGKFIEENNLPRFNLVNLRATGSDLVDEITGGDIRAQQVMLNHSKVETTEQHYTSAAARERRQEKLALAMAWRERYARSGGKSDSRGKTGAHRAATAGYECFDPFDSPISGQVRGRMCTAFGMCPICPMRGLNTKSPVSLLLLRQLRLRLEEAREEIAPLRWNIIWKPVYDVVLVDIGRYSLRVKRAASKMTPQKYPAIE